MLLVAAVAIGYIGEVAMGRPLDVTAVALVGMGAMAGLPLWIGWRDERRLLDFVSRALEARPIGSGRGRAAAGAGPA